MCKKIDMQNTLSDKCNKLLHFMQVLLPAGTVAIIVSSECRMLDSQKLESTYHSYSQS